MAALLLVPEVGTAPVSCGRVRRSFNICFTFGENWFWLSLGVWVRSAARTQPGIHYSERNVKQLIVQGKYQVWSMEFVATCTVYVLCVLWHWWRVVTVTSPACCKHSSRSRDSVTLSHNTSNNMYMVIQFKMKYEILGSTSSFQPSYKHMSCHGKLSLGFILKMIILNFTNFTRRRDGSQWVIEGQEKHSKIRKSLFYRI